MSIRILRSGIYSTIQDLGRFGYRYYAVPPSGTMDNKAAMYAKLLLDSPHDAPIIEMTWSGDKILFDQNYHISLTGADMLFAINDQLVMRYEVIAVKKGDILTSTYARDGIRAYLAIKGDWKLDKHLGSWSTYDYAQIGGYQGRSLQAGDIIDIEPHQFELSSYLDIPQMTYNDINSITIQKGPEYDLLVSKERLTMSDLMINENSNRMGAILDGQRMYVHQPDNSQSTAVVPGMIQCTPKGQLIVLLNDCQTTGGYPRIAYISGSSLSDFNQIRPKQQFRFVLAD